MAPAPGLATGANRRRKTGDVSGAIGGALGAERFLEPPALRRDALPDEAWNGAEMWGASGAFYLIDQPTTFFDPQSADLPARLENALKKTAVELARRFSTRRFVVLRHRNDRFVVGRTAVSDRHHEIRRGRGAFAVVSGAPSQRRKSDIRSVRRASARQNSGHFQRQIVRLALHRGAAPTANLVRLPKPAGHYDLLYSARRRYRSELPNCRLQTLEAGICKRGRRGDIPSGRIPDQYYDFLDPIPRAQHRRATFSAGDISLRPGRVNHGRTDLLYGGMNDKAKG